jgi:hypothetical protein
MAKQNKADLNWRSFVGPDDNGRTITANEWMGTFGTNALVVSDSMIGVRTASSTTLLTVNDSAIKFNFVISMKKVLIATPCLDQKVDAYFVHSLCESIKLGLKNGLDIKCIFLANESILPMARNGCFFCKKQCS